MPHMEIILDGDNCWPDLVAVNAAGKLEWYRDAPIQVALLKGGMVGGNYSVSFRVDLPDGRVFGFETSAALFVQAAKAIEVRASDQFKPIEVPAGWKIDRTAEETVVYRASGQDPIVVPNDELGPVLSCLMIAQMRGKPG